MCTNYISGLPSRALSRAEWLLKINLDVEVKLLVNNQVIYSNIAAHCTTGRARIRRYIKIYKLAVLQISHLHTDTD